MPTSSGQFVFGEGTVWRAQSKGKSEKWIECDLKNFS
jgi:hypothetical protein